jgi:hypothetical protein
MAGTLFVAVLMIIFMSIISNAYAVYINDFNRFRVLSWLSYRLSLSLWLGESLTETYLEKIILTAQ